MAMMKRPDERATTLRSSLAFDTSAKAVSLRYSLFARWPLCSLRRLVAVCLLSTTACAVRVALEHNVRSGRDSNSKSTEWITDQVCLLFRWPQLFPWTSIRRCQPNLETSETPCATRAHARVARQNHARHAPLDRAQGRRARQDRTRGHLETKSTRRCAKNEYSRAWRKPHRQALQQRQGAALYTRARGRDKEHAPHAERKPSRRL